MTQEEKELLLQDLCARLPYEIIVECNDNDASLPNVWEVVYINVITEDVYLFNIDIETTATKLISIEDTKPYLFPLSSMTEEQKNQLKEIWGTDMDKAIDYSISGKDELCDLFQLSAAKRVIDWLISNHFDFRNLIGRGLAIDCTNLNIY